MNNDIDYLAFFDIPLNYTQSIPLALLLKEYTEDRHVGIAHTNIIRFREDRECYSYCSHHFYTHSLINLILIVYSCRLCLFALKLVFKH